MKMTYEEPKAQIIRLYVSEEDKCLRVVNE